jgi:hypothetical protein
MKTDSLSSRFLDEVTNQRSSRFLREATGLPCLRVLWFPGRQSDGMGSQLSIVTSKGVAIGSFAANQVAAPIGS